MAKTSERFTGGSSTTGKTVTLTTSAATTPEIDIARFAWGEIYIPTGSSITTLTYHVAPEMGGTYLPAQDSSGTAVTQTVGAAKAYPVPAAIWGAYAIRIVANAAGAISVSFKT